MPLQFQVKPKDQIERQVESGSDQENSAIELQFSASRILEAESDSQWIQMSTLEPLTRGRENLASFVTTKHMCEGRIVHEEVEDEFEE